MENLSKEEVLKKIYYNPDSPGSFGGVDALFREASKRIPTLDIKDVKDWLSGELVYTLHKQARRKFKRNPMMAEKPKENMQADLVDMQQFSRFNQGYKYILTAIDIFSKKAFAIPIKNKTQQSVVEAMKRIVSQYTPFKLMTDKGKEFENNLFKNLMKKYNIHHYFAKNKEIKCAVVERFNKTLKNKMFRYFTKEGSYKYTGVLDKLMDAYNDSYHRSIKMSPNQVTNENKEQVFKNLFGVASKREYLKKFKRPKLPEGDTVRQKYELKTHDRGYYPYWTDQIYEIYKAVPGRLKPYYQLKDQSGNVDKKRFYPEEIQKIKKNLDRVEKVLRQRKFRGKKQFFVKWLNYPDSYNSWIDAKDLTSING